MKRVSLPGNGLRGWSVVLFLTERITTPYWPSSEEMTEETASVHMGLPCEKAGLAWSGIDKKLARNTAPKDCQPGKKMARLETGLCIVRIKRVGTLAFAEGGDTVVLVNYSTSSRFVRPRPLPWCKTGGANALIQRVNSVE